jgi:hypothetical protein
MDNLTDAAPNPDRRPEQARLDLKALRIAVHGWWLGNPLVYKPGAPIADVSRELARAGATSGTLILSDTDDVSDTSSKDDESALRRYVVRGMLILRLPLSRIVLGEAATLAIGEVAQSAFGHSYAITDQWDVLLCDSRSPSPILICHIAVDAHDDALFLDLRIDPEQLRAVEQEGDQPTESLLARPDWREVFLARVLHALDIRLRSLLSIDPTARQTPGA